MAKRISKRKRRQSARQERMGRRILFITAGVVFFLVIMMYILFQWNN